MHVAILFLCTLAALALTLLVFCIAESVRSTRQQAEQRAADGLWWTRQAKSNRRRAADRRRAMRRLEGIVKPKNKELN